jgi:hypothetical protein
MISKSEEAIFWKASDDTFDISLLVLQFQSEVKFSLNDFCKIPNNEKIRTQIKPPKTNRARVEHKKRLILSNQLI